MNNLTADERKFLNYMHRVESAGTPVWLATIAIICVIGGESHVDPPDGYTRGDFKRTIRVIRQVQATEPRFTADFDKAVALVRRGWLHTVFG